MFHIDLYRLKNEAEAIEAGVEDCLLSGSLCIVEWPEIAPGIFPAGTLHCHLKRVSEYERKLQINL
jgi:tRNA threonylcarbamoyladenosine biosynthesis protein TsaE